MVSVQEAIVVELFALLVMLFAGFSAVSDTYHFGDWDLIGRMSLWMLLGLAIGAFGVISGLRSDD